jgi:multisubunit Na+/H+ antiporter MnhG subunit
VVIGWALVALGALFILLGWIGVSGTPDVARQLSYLASGGLGGLVAAIVGVGLLISEDLRSERKRLGRIEATLLDVNDRLQTTASARGR